MRKSVRGFPPASRSSRLLKFVVADRFAQM
jgi:hypothetical protein